MATKEIYSISEANKALSDSYGELSESLLLNKNFLAGWTIVARITSGSAFWRAQNKIRAVADAYGIMDKKQKENIETMNKAAETMEMLRKAQKKMPKRSEITGEFDPEDIRKTKEFKNQRSAFARAYGSVDKGDKALEDQIIKQLKVNEKVMASMHKRQADAIRYQAMGWRLDKKLAFKTMKFMQFVGNVMRMSAKFLGNALLWSFLLILLIPLAIKFFKNFKDILANMGISLGLEDIKKALNFAVDIFKTLLEIIQLMFAGDIVGALKLYVGEILIPIFGLVMKALPKIIEILAALFSAFVKTLIESVIAIPGIIKREFNASLKRSLSPSVGGLSKTKMFASGGTSAGGMALVGERGPELVNLPPGARVNSNAASRNMGGGGAIHVHVNGRVGASDAEIRDIAQKVAREIKLQMNRTGSAVGRF